MAIPLFNIGGLASGLDTNSIMLDVERIPIQQLEARRTDHQVEDNAWQSIKTRYSAIRTALNALDSEGDFEQFATATSSNTSAVAVSTTRAATPRFDQLHGGSAGSQPSGGIGNRLLRRGRSGWCGRLHDHYRWRRPHSDDNRRNDSRAACGLNQRTGHWRFGLSDLRRRHRSQSGAVVGRHRGCQQLHNLRHSRLARHYGHHPAGT